MAEDQDSNSTTASDSGVPIPDAALADRKIEVVPRQYLKAFVLTTCCFALWGFANDITNPLVKLFKEVFLISNTQSTLVQFAFYGGYFTMALPAAVFIRRFSYKGAIMVGFALYAIGALLSIPASLNANFWIFIAGFYVLTFGLAFLETSCNPYILAMGPPETATQRLNLAQAFNPMGSLIGMMIASTIIAPNLQVGEFRSKMESQAPEAIQYVQSEFPDGLPDFEQEFGALDSAVGTGLANMKSADPEVFDAMQQHDLGVVRTPYVVIAAVVLGFLALFAVTKMPTFAQPQPDAPLGQLARRLLAKAHYREGVIAQAFYVGAQITCWTFIIHYGMEQVGLTLGEAQNWNIAAMCIFLFSRFICTFMLKFVSPGKLLAVLAIVAACLTFGAIMLAAKTGLVCLVLVSACMSLMFPTIYGIALKGLPAEEAKLGSAGLIMAIVGGALLPLMQGWFIDEMGVRNSFYLPLICFVVIAIFGFRTFTRYESEEVQTA
ncbi:L-fucose-proton symporter [Rubripirellula lacrimiformis]|uniref:L-fucose-proton symporter n=1 Tax=Rubripirellula lacrimiformis TaxID=1930273 RepID=A0A517NBV7_9BACT|nr:sugar MFS transporter [Rubripirellula lacrimiformis]QDT04619.1 L-fucose-proton symporter [Rubripirellula lacrimiformis]